MRETLQKISERDPQSPTCGPRAPEICENGCIGCIARAALKQLDRYEGMILARSAAYQYPATDMDPSVDRIGNPVCAACMEGICNECIGQGCYCDCQIPAERTQQP